MPELARRSLLLGGLAAIGLAACAGAERPRSPELATGFRTERRVYGDHDQAVGDLWVPVTSPGEKTPIVILVHGGFWRDSFSLDLMDPLARDLTEAGWLAWNIEYRRVGSGGGWPTTFEDVAAAVDHVAVLGDDLEGPVVDLDRVAIVGHSAGGHLAAWAMARHRLPDGAPGASPTVRPDLAIAQAGVLDLAVCATTGTGGTACPDLLGGRPDEVPERYEVASPAALLPTGATLVAVHGDRDRNVPLAQSVDHVAAATAAGDDATLEVIDGADHFDVIDPGHEAWTVARRHLAAHFDT